MFQSDAISCDLRRLKPIPTHPRRAPSPGGRLWRPSYAPPPFSREPNATIPYPPRVPNPERGITVTTRGSNEVAFSTCTSNLTSARAESNETLSHRGAPAPSPTVVSRSAMAEPLALSSSTPSFDLEVGEVANVSELAAKLHEACAEGRSTEASQLVEVASVELGGFATHALEEGLFIACNHGHAICVELLLAAHASALTALPGESTTALHVASQCGSSECVRLLLSARAHADAPNDDGATPLFVAAYHGHAACVSILCELRASPHATYGDASTTPLHAACQYGRTACTSALIEAGASVDAMDDEGASPLYIACENGNLECAVRLLRTRADANQPAADGSTP